jgi:uncharacterized protein YggT (Ycf19 family)
MGLIDCILNIVGVLLWLSWRSVRYDPLGKASPATLAATLKRAEPRRLKGWPYLVSLMLLLLFRAVAYKQLATSVGWTPKLDLGMVVVPFRNDSFRSVLVYSIFSFARILILVYLWVLILSLLNRGEPESGPLQKLLRVQLGRIHRWRWLAQALLPLWLISGLWVAVYPVLLGLGLITRVSSHAHLLEQGLLVAAAAYCTLKFLLPVILMLYLVVSYVYLGSNPLWDFVTTTSRTLLVPLRRLPLKLGRLDLAPIVGVILLLVVLQVLPNLLRSNSRPAIWAWLPTITWPQ